MAFKILILLCVAFSLCQAREIAEPDLSLDEKYSNMGPSSVHSIKGKFYEERVISSKPDKSYHETKHLKPDVNVASELENILTKMADREQTKDGEKILFRRNKDNDGSINPTLDPINDFNVSKSNFKNNVSVDKHDSDNSKTKINTSPIMHFHAEKVISGQDKNKTIETIKRELAFDSLLIKNEFNNNGHFPENITYSSKSQESNPKVVMAPDLLVQSIFENPNMQQLDEPNRRLGNTNNLPISNPFQMPIRNENNFFHLSSKMKPTNNDLSNTVIKPVTPMPSKLSGENDVIAILPNFEHKTNNYDRQPPNGMSANTPLRQNYYNVIDKHTCDDNESDESEQSQRSGYDVLAQEPTKGHGITTVVKTPVMLMDHPRVCYACSSINDLTCWSPDRTTSVKYCRGDHPSCLTKHYKYKGLSFVIRDCGNTCELNALAGGPTKYSACTICHHDLCNSAFHFKIQNVVVLFLVFHLLYVVNVSVN